jgi:carbonic anhydrase
MNRHPYRIRAVWAAGLAAAALAVPVPAVAATPRVPPAAATPRVPPAAATPAWSHNPALPNGPARWATLSPDWAACGGKGDQSPIAINGARPALLPAVRVDYPRTPLVVENTGHVVEVPQPAGLLRVGTATYRLVQWHVHAPSEHVVRGHRYDLEIHLVHQDDRGATLVLAVLAGIARPARAGAADLLRRTLRAAPEEAGEETDTGTEASAVALLPSDVRRLGPTGAVVSRYLTYEGSLTTPPCTTGVRWVVLPTPVRVDAGTVGRMHALVAGFPGYGGYPDNNRPLQPLGSRTVRSTHPYGG